MTHDIGLERMIGASPAPASRPVVVTVVVTLSLLITTPGALSLTSPLSGFLLKVVILVGVALYTAAEALEATS